MKSPFARSCVRLCVLAAAVAAAATLLFGAVPTAAAPRRPHGAHHHVRRHARAGTVIRVRQSRAHNAHRIARAHREPLIIVGRHWQAPEGVPTIEVPGPSAVQVNRAAYVPPTPDIPPLEPRTWAVHVTATETGLSPDTIVAEPGQRIAITFDNRGDPSNELVFVLPGRTVVFSGDLAGFPRHTSTIVAPDTGGRYQFYSTTSSGQQTPPGWLIVSPTAAGASEPVYGARDIRIVARDFSLNPQSPIVVPGERLRVTYFNGGNSPHNLAFAFPFRETTFPDALVPGEMRTMTLIIPAQGGRCYFYDPVAGNRDRGMEGTLLIYRPPGAPRSPSGAGARPAAARGAAWGLGPR